MDPFTTLTAIAAPMPRPNINTDDIFPGPAASPIWRDPRTASLMTDRAQMGRNAFAAVRFHDDGSPQPDFVLNQAPWSAARIIVGGANFGCGSSREMAVWALQGIGIRAIVAPSFGDIFRSNCFRNGLLPVILPPDQSEAIMEWLAAATSPMLTIDLHSQRLTVGALSIGFTTPPYQRQALLEGLDEIEATLRRLPHIRAFEAAYRAAHPWIPYASAAHH